MKKRTLTKKQLAVFNFIEQFIIENVNRRGPYIREICQHFGFTSTATAYKYIDALVAAGVIVCTGQPGGILLTDNSDHVKVPVLGTISSAGIVWTTQAGQFLRL